MPYAGPVLVYVEAGTLGLDDVGEHVSILYPREERVVGTPEGGREIVVRQVSEAPAAGGSAEIEGGGSAYAVDGDLGPTRNAGDESLILLVVGFVTQPETAEMIDVPA